jgi:hypothetical protein
MSDPVPVPQFTVLCEGEASGGRRTRLAFVELPEGGRLYHVQTVLTFEGAPIDSGALCFVDSAPLRVDEALDAVGKRLPDVFFALRTQMEAEADAREKAAAEKVAALLATTGDAAKRAYIASRESTAEVIALNLDEEWALMPDAMKAFWAKLARAVVSGPIGPWTSPPDPGPFVGPLADGPEPDAAPSDPTVVLSPSLAADIAILDGVEANLDEAEKKKIRRRRPAA